MIYFRFLLLTGCLFFACNKNNQSELAELYAKGVLLEILWKNDLIKQNQLFEVFLKKKGFTNASFYEELNKIKNDPVVWGAFLEQAINSAKNIKRKDND